MAFLVVKTKKRKIYQGKFKDETTGEVVVRQRYVPDGESYLYSADPVMWVPWIEMAIKFATRREAEQVLKAIDLPTATVEALV